MCKFKFNKALGLQIVAFGAFATMAISSASTKEERKSNRDAFMRGWEIGRSVYDDASIDEVTTDSLLVVFGEEMADGQTATAIK